MRVGVIDFCNSFPLFYALKNQIVPNDLALAYGTPREINSKLYSGDLDIAMISSAEFLSHPDAHVIHSALGIAATKKVISVRLFFTSTVNRIFPILDRTTLLIPSHSATSVRLLKVLCAHVWNVTPLFEITRAVPKDLFAQDLPFLLIGDDCLRHLHSTTHHSIDLAQCWNEATSKSMIFSFMAANRVFFESHRDEALSFYQLLDSSYRWAQANQETILQSAVIRTGCCRNLLKTYYETIDYRLTEKHFSDFEYFALLSANISSHGVLIL